jgi:6-phosphogluconate dehydrogenase
MTLQIPIPTIDIAVTMRDMSVFESQRSKASKLYQRAIKSLSDDKTLFLEKMENALYASIITTYAQGFALLIAASAKYEYQIDIESVALIWRGGCIIRSCFLNDISAAFRTQANLENILLDQSISRKLMDNQEGLRQVVSQAAESGISIPALMVSLGYLDAYRSSWLPANLIQAQRDYFGAHTYERIDSKGTFHTEWVE